jgi:hypothetical protein
MKKEVAVLGFVLCVLGGFAVGIMVGWPAGPVGGHASGSGALEHPTKGTGTALFRIFEVSDFQ